MVKLFITLILIYMIESNNILPKEARKQCAESGEIIWGNI